MTICLSVFVGFHDSGVAFSRDKEIILALHAERVFRKKHMRATWEQIEQLVSLGLEETNARISDVDTLYIAHWGCETTEIVKLLGKRFAPVWTSHHANHVGWASSLGWTNGIAICADGGSENGCSAIYRFSNGIYEPIVDLDHTILTGRYYGAITQAIFQSSQAESHIHLPGKTMGLSAFGRFRDNYASTIKTYESSFTRLDDGFRPILTDAFGLCDAVDSFDWNRWDLAYTAQRVWEDTWIEELTRLKSLDEKLIFSGGCALNVLLNERIHSDGGFSDIFVPPAPGDEGQAIGALVHKTKANCPGPFLGRTWGNSEEMPTQAIEDLVAGKIVFWFDGRSEIGPRALGHRSILASAGSIASRRRLSEQIKGREWYRPVAPIVTAESAAEWFELSDLSPWMARAVKATQKTVDLAPAAVHVDGTSRLQTLEASENPVLHQILTEYGEVTGVPILLNTSMNLPGEPICDSPRDAVKTFRQTQADVLYVCGQRYTQETCMNAIT